MNKCYLDPPPGVRKNQWEDAKNIVGLKDYDSTIPNWSRRITNSKLCWLGNLGWPEIHEMFILASEVLNE